MKETHFKKCSHIVAKRLEWPVIKSCRTPVKELRVSPPLILSVATPRPALSLVGTLQRNMKLPVDSALGAMHIHWPLFCLVGRNVISCRSECNCKQYSSCGWKELRVIEIVVSILRIAAPFLGKFHCSCHVPCFFSSSFFFPTSFLSCFLARLFLPYLSWFLSFQEASNEQYPGWINEKKIQKIFMVEQFMYKANWHLA